MLWVSFAQAQETYFSEESRERGLGNHYFATNAMGGGAAFFDYDNDGDQDLLTVGGLRPETLYDNDGTGHFTARTDLQIIDELRKYGTMGVTTGDIDNDGWTDVLITTLDGPGPDGRVDAPCLLLRNLGNGQFANISEQAGIQRTVFSHSASFLDINNDGFLDIYVSGHVNEPRLKSDSTGLVVAYDHDCYRNLLYINQGNLTFQEQGVAYGLDDTGCGLAQINTDYDQDGDQDIYLANDFGMFIEPNALFQNDYPNAAFSNMNQEKGTGLGMFAMGVAASDYDQDGDLDYYITNIGANALIQQQDDGSFLEVAAAAGVANEKLDDGDLNTTGWGTAFVDIDHDGWDDLFVSNGHIGTLQQYLTGRNDPNKLYRNRGDGTFEDISAQAGIEDRQIGRGLAVADVDGDGDQDFFGVVIGQDEDFIHSQLFINQMPKTGNYVQVELEGVVANRDAIGARVEIYAGGRFHLREVYGGGASYCSKSSNVLHAGLGEVAQIDSLRIFWPGSGQVDTYYDLAPDTRYQFTEQMAVSTQSPTGGEAIGLRLFPNPSRGNAMVATDQPVEVRWQLIDPLGRAVAGGLAQWGPTPQRLSTTLPSLPGGLYSLVVYHGQERFVQRMVVR